MKVNHGQPAVKSPNFGMALKVKGRAINDTAIFPNKHADIIRRAVAKGNDRLEKIAKDVDITIDVEPPDRGLDFEGVKNILVITASKLKKNNGIFSSVKSFFTDPVAGMKLNADELAKFDKPEDVIIELAETSRKDLLNG